MKVGEIRNAFNALSNAKMQTLTDAERVSIVRIRRALRPVAEEYNDFEKDLIETLKCEGFDEMAAKAQARTLKGEDAARWNTIAASYNRALLAAMKQAQEEEKDVKCEEHISEATALKIIAENEWAAGVMDDLDIIIK